MSGKLETGLEVAGVVNEFMRALSPFGVAIDDLKTATTDKARMQDIARAIKSRETSREERLAKLATLADTLDGTRVGVLLSATFPQSPHLVRLFSDREAFERLLNRIRRLGSWRRAAIVMRYGLGRDGRIYEVREIAEMAERSPKSIAVFLSPNLEVRAQTAAKELRFARLNGCPRSNAEAFRPLELSEDLRWTLAHSLDVRNLAELQFCTQGELEAAMSVDYLRPQYDELMRQLEERGISLQK